MSGIAIFVILIIAIVGIYLVASGKLSFASLLPTKNDFPTLNTVLDQTSKSLPLAQSTNGLFGFSQPNSPTDPNAVQQNILVKDLVSEDAIRNIVNQQMSTVQLNIPSGTGQGTQTKTISLQDALALFNAQDNAMFTKALQTGTIKLAQDPTSGLVGISLTQETINRAKTDPQLAQALGILQTKALVGSG